MEARRRHERGPAEGRRHGGEGWLGAPAVELDGRRRHGSEEEVGAGETGAGLLLWIEEGDEWRGKGIEPGLTLAAQVRGIGRDGD